MSIEAEGPWHRISPLSMIHQGLSFLRQLAGNPGAFAGMVAGAYAFLTRSPDEALAALVSLLLAGLCFLTIAWLRFGYRLDDDAIQIRRGVFTRERVKLPFARIQTVRTERPLYLRPFGLVRLSIESAGSSAQEVHLAGIAADQAAAIRERAAWEGHTQPAAPDSTESEAPAARTLLLTRSIGDLVRYGISSPIILWGAVALSSLGGAAMRRLERQDDAEAQLQALQATLTGWAPPMVSVTALILALVLLLTSLSIAIALLRYSGYRLESGNGRFAAQGGLLTQREQVVRDYKIQHLSLNQNLVARLLGRRHLVCHQIGPAIQEGPDAGQQLTAPSLTPQEQQTLVPAFCPGLSLADLDIRGVSPRFMLPRFAFWIPAWVAALLAVAFSAPGTGLATLAQLAGPIAAVLIVLAWKRQGWAWQGEFLVLRQGLFGIRYRIFAPYRAQSVMLAASPLQRRRDLCNLIIRLSSGAFQIPYMKKQDAISLADRLLYQMETSRAPWL